MSNGFKHTKIPAEPYGISYNQGDLITVSIRDGSLSFAVNGQDQGVAFSGFNLRTTRYHLRAHLTNPPNMHPRFNGGDVGSIRGDIRDSFKGAAVELIKDDGLLAACSLPDEHKSSIEPLPAKLLSSTLLHAGLPDDTHTIATALSTPGLAGPPELTSVDEKVAVRAQTTAQFLAEPRPNVQLVLQALQLRPDLNGCAVQLQKFVKEKGKWQVQDIRTSQEMLVKGSSLQLQEWHPPPHTTLTGLQGRSELNGKPIAVLSYCCEKEKFVVTCEEEQLLEVQGHNIHTHNGSEQPAPFALSASTLVPGQKALHASHLLQRGQVIFDEAPLILVQQSHGDDFDTTIKALHAFFALSQEEQSNILSLHANASITVTFPSAAMQLVNPSFNDIEDDQLSLSGRAMVERLRCKGFKVPSGQEHNAALFVRVWDTNSFAFGANQSALFINLSRIDHSCEPNSERLEYNGRFRLVALCTILPNEPLTISYLQQMKLLEPWARRQEHLKVWIKSCLCVRCSSKVDDVRCFRCPKLPEKAHKKQKRNVKACTGMCTARKLQGMTSCSDCGATATNVGSLLKDEQQIVAKYLEFEQNPMSVEPEKLMLLIHVATRALAPQHWAAAAIGDLAQDFFSQLREHHRALDHLQAWCNCWRAHLKVPSLRLAWKLEQQADVHTLLGSSLNAVTTYLEALDEIRHFPANHTHILDIKKKARNCTQWRKDCT